MVVCVGHWILSQDSLLYWGSRESLPAFTNQACAGSVGGHCILQTVEEVKPVPDNWIVCL